MKIKPLTIISKLNDLLDRAQKKKILIIFFLFLLMSLFQVIGVAAIFPFINLVMDPSMIETNRLLNLVYRKMNFSDVDAFVIFIGIAIFCLILFSNVLSAFTVWAKTRFVMGLNHSLSRKLLSLYLSKPYIYFLNKNSASMGKKLLAEVYQLTNKMLIPIFELIVNLLVIIAIVTLLFFTNFKTTFVALIILGGSYTLIHLYIKKRIKKSGEEWVKANEGRYKTTGESLTGIKATKVVGREKFFVDKYSQFSKRFTRVETYVKVASELPKYILEAIAFGGIILLVVILTITEGDAKEVIPLVSLFAFAGYRMMPAMQKVFHSLTNINFNQAILDSIHSDIIESDNFELENIEPVLQNMIFQKELNLKDVSFNYPKSEIPTLHQINLVVKKNSSIGFVGSTGSGKTTLIDTIMGLLIPQVGGMYVDDVRIVKDNIRSWQNNIGYVPQDIFLTDDTIMRNIAFGIPDDEIEFQKVLTAAKIAFLDSFIENELPAKYDTVIGERGVRLSGGQRQRIGLARALYNNPEVLVLDEATSSLDGVTETSVIEAIKNASKNRTMIMIAHRLGTVKDCDKIFIIEKGRIIDSGSYDDLMDRNIKFKKMAKS